MYCILLFAGGYVHRVSDFDVLLFLDPHEGPIEDHTQHYQELEHKVSEGTTFTPRIITVNAGEVISSIFSIGRCTSLTKISCNSYIYFPYNCND